MKKRLLLAFSAVLVCSLFALGVSILISYRLIVTEYNIEVDNIDGSLRICQLSDLHCREYGENNGELIEAIYEINPDVIFMTGDMFSRDSSYENLDKVCRLISALGKEYMIYYSLGNHEHDHDDIDDYLAMIADAGATVLDYSYIDTEICGISLRIGGIYGTLSYTSNENDEKRFLDDFNDTELPKILLSHIFEGLIEWHGLDMCEADIVFSGHAHGGEVRLPFIGGLYDPLLGMFPEITDGIVYESDTYVVISAGLGASPKVPRINNPGEIVVLNINR